MKIRRVGANKPSFHEVRLEDGLNIILAERHSESTDRDSRNGVGKSTLVEVINFCLGSSLTKKSVIHQLKGSDWVFIVDLEIGDAQLSVSRSLQSPGTITLVGDLDQLPVLRGTQASLTGQRDLSLKVWRELLGLLCFDIDERVREVKYAPTFRALISYFARSGRDAYIDPFTTSRQVRSWQKQVYNAYLIGLNWRHAVEWQNLKDDEASVKAPAKSTAAKKRATLSGLENERVRLFADQQRMSEQIARFRVVPEYEAIESEARQITSKMRELGNESAVLAQVISKYEQQMNTESSGDLDRVHEIYAEAGLLFPDRVTRDLSDVINFHNEVTRHRRDYLHNEILRLRARSTEIQSCLEENDNRRAELLNILNQGGAVEELGALQVRLGRTMERLEEIDKRIAELESSAAGEASLASGRQALLSRALLDRAERRPKWSTVTAHFAEVTRYLYGEPADIDFGLNESGFVFQVNMTRPGSNGVENMAMFSYDMALTRTWQTHGRHPGFLLHDSLLYEGVDERQIALALRYARDFSLREGFQYIAFINSDNVPDRDLSELGLQLEDYVRLRLGDARAEDALLGYRFGQSSQR